ncbi:MAG TPA: hypothetical protein VFX37_14085 [Pseudolabrys sp.]|nr:hypothetical protein [Pseudolabrys sp.]
MKLNVLVIALAATAFGSLGANAQTVIEERRDPGVVIQHDHPDASVTVHEHGGVVGTEKKTVTHETNGLGCSSKTVHKEDVTGSKTVNRKNCD